jgi:hypothetical protein
VHQELNVDRSTGKWRHSEVQRRRRHIQLSTF